MQIVKNLNIFQRLKTVKGHKFIKNNKINLINKSSVQFCSKSEQSREEQKQKEQQQINYQIIGLSIIPVSLLNYYFFWYKKDDSQLENQEQKRITEVKQQQFSNINNGIKEFYESIQNKENLNQQEFTQKLFDLALEHSDKSSSDNLIEALFGFMYLKQVLELDQNHLKANFNIAVFLREYPSLFINYDKLVQMMNEIYYSENNQQINESNLEQIRKLTGKQKKVGNNNFESLFEESVKYFDKVENLILKSDKKKELEKYLMNARYERTSAYFLYKDANFCQKQVNKESGRLFKKDDQYEKYKYKYQILQGMTYNLQGKSDKSIKIYKDLLQVSPDLIDKNDRLQICYYLATIYQNEKKYKEAIEWFTYSLEIEPNQASSYIHLGLNYMYLEDIKKSVENYHKALKINPKSAATYYNLGNVYLHEGKFELAEYSYNKAIQIDPTSHIYYMNKGVALQSLNRNEESLACFEQVLQIQPNFVDAVVNKGILQSILQNNDDAIKTFSYAKQIQPQYQQIYINEGNLYEKTGRYEDALKCYEEGIQSAQDLYTVFEFKMKIALLYVDIGDIEKSKEQLQQILKKDKNHVQAQQLLSALNPK